MRFMVIMIPNGYRGNKAKPDILPDARMIEKMTRFNEDLGKEVEILTLDGLHPLVSGTRLEFSGGKPRVIDGPHIETKEVFGGYWILKAKSKEQVLEWMKRCPAEDGDIIEIRKIFEMEDFAPEAQAAAKGAKA